MKWIKKLFYMVAIVIMAGCIFVLICALNPSLTRKLASLMEQNNSLVPEGISGNEIGSQGNGASGEAESVQVGYIAPSQDSIALPEQVWGMTGYEPVWGEEEQVPDEEAEQLKDSLSVGEVGEDLTFDTSIYPYYGMLDEELQQLYRQIYANAQELKTSFSPVITVGINRVKDVFEAVYNDHPELFWLETEYSCKYSRKGICLEITLKYNDTANDLAASKKLFEEQAQAIVAEAAKRENDSEKELFIHDTLVKRVDYSTNAVMNQSAYSALVGGKSVCAGYARAFQYLMQQLSIPCYYCTGYSGENHAWNIVKLDGAYWNVDVTWDDTSPSTYDYYNKTDLEYAKTHVRKGLSVYLPACNGNANGITTPSSAENNGQDTAKNDLTDYINPNPQEPLSYPSGLLVTERDQITKEQEENLKKAGITEEEVMDDMPEYYADCLEKLVESGAGQQYFSNVIPQTIWSSVEEAYSNSSYEKGYVTEALKKLEMDSFAIQLQVDDIGGGYYRIYHSVVTWKNET